MKPWQSQPGGQAVGKRPAEWALHGGFFSRPTHLGRRGQRPAGLSRLIRARKFPAPLRACGASRQRSYRGFLLNHPEISALHRFHPRWGAGIGAEQGENGNLVAAKPSGKILILLSKTSFFERNSVT